MSNKRTDIMLNITYGNAGGIKEICESILYDMQTLIETYGEIGVGIKIQVCHIDLADDMAAMTINSSKH